MQYHWKDLKILLSSLSLVSDLKYSVTKYNYVWKSDYNHSPVSYMCLMSVNTDQVVDIFSYYCISRNIDSDFNLAKTSRSPN